MVSADPAPVMLVTIAPQTNAVLTDDLPDTDEAEIPAAATVAVPPMTNREHLGDPYSSSDLGVVWDAERFWQGEENGGKDHLSGFNPLNQLKLSVVRSGQELLTPAECRAIGTDMYPAASSPTGSRMASCTGARRSVGWGGPPLK